MKLTILTIFSTFQWHSVFSYYAAITTNHL